MSPSGSKTEEPCHGVSPSELHSLLQTFEAETKRTTDFKKELIAAAGSQKKEDLEHTVIEDYKKVNAVLARWAEQVDVITANHLCPAVGAAPLLASNKRARSDAEGDDEGPARKSRK